MKRLSGSHPLLALEDKGAVSDDYSNVRAWTRDPAALCRRLEGDSSIIFSRITHGLLDRWTLASAAASNFDLGSLETNPDINPNYVRSRELVHLRLNEFYSGLPTTFARKMLTMMERMRNDEQCCLAVSITNGNCDPECDTHIVQSSTRVPRHRVASLTRARLLPLGKENAAGYTFKLIALDDSLRERFQALLYERTVIVVCNQELALKLKHLPDGLVDHIVQIPGVHSLGLTMLNCDTFEQEVKSLHSRRRKEHSIVLLQAGVLGLGMDWWSTASHRQTLSVLDVGLALGPLLTGDWENLGWIRDGYLRNPWRDPRPHVDACPSPEMNRRVVDK